MLPKFEVGTISLEGPLFPQRAFSFSEPLMTKDADHRSSPADRARLLTKPFAGDEALDRWATLMVAAADDFQRSKRPDPLGGFLPTHSR